MQQDFSRLTRELRKETCPQGVLDAVGRRIERRSPSRRRFAIAVAFAGAIVVCCLAGWGWQAGVSARRQAELERVRLGRVQVATQARDALGLIGMELVDAGAHSGKIISDRAVPPLRDSFQTAKNKIIQHIEL